jgi:hypothetical protein
VKVYLISSSFVWGIQFLALMDAKFPVWYPYYGSWAIALAFDIILLATPCVLRKPAGAFDFISISVQSLRVCSLSVLLCLYLVLRNLQNVHDNDDAERQSLLRADGPPKLSSSEESGQNPNSYGAITNSSSNDAAKNADEEGSKKKTDEEDNEYFKERREDEERLAKRLKEGGNWWTYAKAFAVSVLV